MIWQEMSYNKPTLRYDEMIEQDEGELNEFDEANPSVFNRHKRILRRSRVDNTQAAFEAIQVEKS